MAKKTKSETTPALSYFSKEKVTCPVCNKAFQKEVMHKGNGRMVAGGLTDELHREFEPSNKFGRVYPLIYDIGVCPNCYTALFWRDFKDLKGASVIDALSLESEERRKKVEVIFPYFNLEKTRTLYDGTAMYYLALLTYEKVSKDMLPTINSAIISLRLAWLCKDINAQVPGRNFDYIAEVFYRKAVFFYHQTLVVEMEKKEKSSTMINPGPDMDKNYSWDGIVYLSGLLEYKYGQTADMQARLKKLSEVKTSIARMFGLGKSSKSKPGPLLEKARELYDSISKLVKEEDF